MCTLSLLAHYSYSVYRTACTHLHVPLYSIRYLFLITRALSFSLLALAVSSAYTVAVLTAAAACSSNRLLDVFNMQPAIIRFAQQSFSKTLFELRLFTIDAPLC
jgi:hypothetical protein